MNKSEFDRTNIFNIGKPNIKFWKVFFYNFF